MKSLTAISGVFAAMLIGQGVAHAGCDLGSCPKVQQREMGTSGTLYVPVDTLVTGYDVAGSTGMYSSADVGVEYWSRTNIVVMGKVRMLSLSPDDASTRIGLGNPMANVQIVTHPLSWLSVAGGLLLEMPFGDAELVDDHWGALKHVQARVVLRTLELRVHGGYLRQLGSSEGEVAAPDDGHSHDHSHDHGGGMSSPIDPHVSKEVRGQGSVGLLLGNWTPSVIWESATEVDDQTIGTQYHSIGGAIGANLGTKVSAKLRLLTPVTDAQRYTWRAGLGVTLQR